MLSEIDSRYGTYRGLIRLWLDRLKWFCGCFRRYGRPDWLQVKRLVFVCQGNICRSPYAHALAVRDGVAATSFGYATTTGQPANSVALKIAAERGLDLSGHRTTDLSDFIVQSGDLLLLVEPRHLAKVRSAVAQPGVQVALLGQWCEPVMPLIYDPHNLSEAYFHNCYARIERAVDNLLGEFKIGSRQPG
jgi:protein-tyrosine phosphatase